MSLLPPYTIEQQWADSERLTLREVVRSITEERPPASAWGRGIMHYQDVFERASAPDDNTGTKDRFAVWFGPDAERIVFVLHTFFSRYLKDCGENKKMGPFRFESDAERAEAIAAFERIRQAMNDHRQGFAIYPPPRIGRCF